MAEVEWEWDGEFKWQETGSSGLQLWTEHKCSTKHLPNLPFCFCSVEGKQYVHWMQWARLEEVQVGHCFTRDDHLGPSIEEREEVQEEEIHILWSHVRSESKRVFLLAEGD